MPINVKAKNVKILGPGCTRCANLERKVRSLAAEHNLTLEIEKVTELDDMLAYGIMASPGLVVDGELKSAGNLPSEKQLLAWLAGESDE